MKLRDLTPARVQQFYDQLTAEGRGARTVQIAHVVLHGCLKQAARLGLVARNPAAACLVPRSPVEEMKVWDEGQVNQFLFSIRGQAYEALYHLALKTGMRRGELLGLEWGDVDWERATITVQRACFHPAGGGWVLQAPKTRRGIRSVKVGPGLLEQMRGQARQDDDLRRMAKGNWEEHDLVFPSMAGTPLDGDSLSKQFRRLVARAGLPGMRLHDCRHTAASIMLSHGIPPVIVAGILGHSLAVLMARYAHFIPDTQDEAARLMDEITTPVAVDLS